MRFCKLCRPSVGLSDEQAISTLHDVVLTACNNDHFAASVKSRLSNSRQAMTNHRRIRLTGLMVYGAT